MQTFSIYEWLQVLALGGLVGAIGQGVRVIVGLKKLNDAASAQSTSGPPVSVSDLIAADRLAVSLAIGFIAGAIAAATTLKPHELSAISGTTVSGLAAAGYAGADFIEGIMSRAMPAPSAPAGSGAVGVGSSSESARQTLSQSSTPDGAVG
jgi:hypothetical protein